MKKYSSKQAKKGKVAYRTPSTFIYRKCQKIAKIRKKQEPFF